jgi:DNA polymerase delta subunit 1
MTNVVFQAIAWNHRETEESFTIDIFGRTEDGQSVHIETPFQPYFFVKTTLGRPVPHFESLVESPVTIRRKDLWGFQNQKEYTFAKLTFCNLESLRRAEWACRNQRYQVYEANLDPVLRLMHRTGIQSTGWLRAQGSPARSSTCAIDLVVSDWRSLKPVDRDDIAPFRMASVDIECYSESGAFPNPFERPDVCFQVAVTTRINGQSHDRKIFCVKETNCPEAESFPTERAMLERFADYLRDELDPDIITGWNIFGFDLEYLYTRMVMVKCDPEAFVWGRLRETPVELVTKNLSSSALGSNTLKLVPMIGRYVFDMFQDVKREHKLESYSLNNVSKVFLGDQKIDMPVREMFVRFREGDPDRLGEVAEYCIKDTELPHMISEKLRLVQNLLEMARATWVPLSYLSERGQQIKVFSQICRKAREVGFMVPTMRPDKNAVAEDPYKGATVLDAQTGAYYTPITALDFASLYPSIMRAHNLCYSTWVDPKTPQFLDLPGVTYERYGTNVFAQGVPSLLPAILDELAAFRKKAKKAMAAAEGTPLEAVYNGRQLAYKISMNSVYGFTGASKGMLPLLAIASTVTMRGRQMIDETKTYVEANFPGAKVRYGDSVMPGTKVRILDPMGFEQRIPIERLAKSWEPYPGFMKDGTHKEKYEIIDEVKSWTHMGWMPIRRVIRHKCHKKIYRVTSPYGTVDVTADHSLLDTQLNLIKPTEVEPSTDLLHCDDAILLNSEPNFVELIHESWDDYVYDLETDAGTFQAGEGFLIVKNTDSVMVEFDVQGRKGQEAIDYSWEQGELASEQCSKLFRAPNDLELEKVYCPYFLYSKKRYAAKMYEKKEGRDGEPSRVVFKKIDIKGLQVVRRDTCGYVRGVLKQLLNLVLDSNDPRPAIEFARQSARTLLAGKIDSASLFMSKQLGSDYKTRQPHVEVRDKIRKRAPGSEPQNGDRVQFLITKGPGLLCEKAEDPGYVAENKVPIDYYYYFDHQLQKPVCDLLEPLVGQRPYDTIFKSVDYLTTRSITSYFKAPGNRASPDHP